MTPERVFKSSMLTLPRRILEIRACAAQSKHWISCGKNDSLVQSEVAYYSRAISVAQANVLWHNLGSWLLSVHEAAMGLSAPSTFRTEPAGIATVGPEGRFRSIPQSATGIADSIADLHRLLSTPQSIVLLGELYFRILRIHPFSNGNGRVARLLFSTYCCSLFGPNRFLDITTVMRTNVRRYNDLLADDDIDGWHPFFNGLLLTEQFSVVRIADAIEKLPESSLNRLNDLVDSTWSGIQSGKGLSMWIETDDAAVKSIVRAVSG